MSLLSPSFELQVVSECCQASVAKLSMLDTSSPSQVGWLGDSRIFSLHSSSFAIKEETQKEVNISTQFTLKLHTLYRFPCTLLINHGIHKFNFTAFPATYSNDCIIRNLTMELILLVFNYSRHWHYLRYLTFTSTNEVKNVAGNLNWIGNEFKNIQTGY